MKRGGKCVLVLFAILLSVVRAGAVEIADDAGQILNFPAPPSRVVSLLPSVTEAICSMGAAESLVGVTYHDTGLGGVLARARIVGGAFTPQFKIIDDLDPDILIIAPRDFKRAKAERGAGSSCPVLVIDDTLNLPGAEARFRMIGEIFGRSAEAERILRENRELTGLISRKIAKIPEARRRRVICLTPGNGGLMTPGDNSFQAEIIAAAGGIPGKFGVETVEPVTLDRWREFAPDVVYAVDEEFGKVRELLSRDGWKEAPAVKNGRVHSFPSTLVCRASARVGYFTAWLASTVYDEEFSDVSKLVLPQEIISERAVPLNVPYVKRARIVESRIMDFVHRTLLVDFKKPQKIISTVSGERNVETAGNSTSPAPTWSIYHKLGFGRSLADLFKVLGLDEGKTDIMVTGADMNNLAIESASYRDMTATAIVTAGVENNAQRASKDAGFWYEPGTINIILMTSHKLSGQALTRAIVTVTEAKTAALWDMDARSAQTPLLNQATGTGTDTVIVVAGEGVPLNSSGGHSKMGELIAEAVHKGVRKAILRQNGKAPFRSVFERLAERDISTYGLIDGSQPELEELLLSPLYSGFIESALSLSDAGEMGQIADLASFNAWALHVAREIAGRPLERVEDAVLRDDLPPVVRTAFDALCTGLRHRNENPSTAAEG